MIGPEFTHSDAGRYAIIAKQFMEAAQTLVAAAPHKQRMLFRPTLTLAGHGLEVMLKACTFLNGETPATSGQVGHNIAKLWESEVCEAVRGHVLINARNAADEARDQRVFSDVPRSDDVERLINEYVKELGSLHTKNLLRYLSDPKTQAPRAPFLVQSLWRTSDDLLKRPNDFILNEFRERILPYC